MADEKEDKKVSVVVDDKAGLGYGGKFYPMGKDLEVLESEAKTFTEAGYVKLKSPSHAGEKK